jgi:hypothetical protein
MVTFGSHQLSVNVQRMKAVLFFVIVSTGCSSASTSPTPISPPPPSDLRAACEINNTATVRLGNDSVSATHDVTFDGMPQGTLAPGQFTAPITIAATIQHTAAFFVAGTSRPACLTITATFERCSTQTVLCDGP